jgi:hypothetical protein
MHSFTLRRMRTALALCILHGAVFSHVAVAAPEPATADAPDARAYFNAGARAYAAGKYVAAIRAFEEAYRIEPRPGLVFSVAQAYRRQFFIDKEKANLFAAIDHYRKYLELEPDGARRGDAAEALSELEPFSSHLAPSDAASAPTAAPATQLMISSPVDDVTISLDGTPAGTLPYIAGVTPGVHRVALTASGYVDYQRDVRVLAGSVVPLDVTLEEKPALVTVVAPDGARIAVDGRFRGVSPAGALALTPGRHFVTVTANGHEVFSREIAVERDEARSITATLPPTTQRTTAWTFIVTGGAALLTGAGFMVAALVREKDAERMGFTTPADARARNDAVDARDRLRTIGIVTAGSGVAVAGLGAFLFAFDEPRSGPQTSPEDVPARPKQRQSSPGLDVSVAPWFLPSAAGASFRGTF